MGGRDSGFLSFAASDWVTLEAAGALAASRLISRMDSPSGASAARPENFRMHSTISGAAMSRRKATFQMLRIRRTARISSKAWPTQA